MDNKKNFGVEIDAAAVMSQYDSEQVTPVKKINFDMKNYLQARLLPTEQTKTMTIRLLPFSKDGGTPFKKVHMHTVKVNKDVSPSGWKTFVCPVKNVDDEGKPFGERCPFCEMADKARELKNGAVDEGARKKYSDIEFINRAKDMWIVRCIERGHEEDGVKFWMFSSSKKKEGVYDKIVNLYRQRNEEDNYNIFSLENGKDLVLTLSRTSDNKTSIQVIDKSLPTPLSTDSEKGIEWINDDKVWQDVYTVKPYEFMSIIVDQGVPRYSKELGGWYDATKDGEVQAEAEREKLEENLTAQKRDFSEISSAQGAQVINGQQYTF